MPSGASPTARPASAWAGWNGSDRALAAHPLLEATTSEGDWRNETAPDKWKHRTWYRPKPGADADDVAFDDIGYARNAIASYAEFRKAKDDGLLPAHVRFMIAIPTPFQTPSTRISRRTSGPYWSRAGRPA